MHLVKTISNPFNTSKRVWVYRLCFAWSQVTLLKEISLYVSILPSRNSSFALYPQITFVKESSIAHSSY
jgi:hypothetical protein